MSLHTSGSIGRQPRKWSPAEDQRLRREVQTQMVDGDVKDWCRVAAHLPGRTNKDCRKRWHNSVAGGLKKGQWSKSEDLQLARGVQEFGPKWTLVADLVASRSADQCAKRWQQSLDPELDRSEWRESEDQILVVAVQRLGRHWKDIQREHFPGRSKNCIKNRYTVLIRRYHNQGMALPQLISTPELSVDSFTDDDMPGSYEELPVLHNVVSTPEAHHSWPVHVGNLSEWTLPAAPTTHCAVSDLTHTVPPQPLDIAGDQSWAWIATDTSHPRPRPMGLLHTYSPTPSVAVSFAYGDFSGSPLHSPGLRRSSDVDLRAPASSPITGSTMSPCYLPRPALAPCPTWPVAHNPCYQY